MDELVAEIVIPIILYILQNIYYAVRYAITRFTDMLGRLLVFIFKKKRTKADEYYEEEPEEKPERPTRKERNQQQNREQQQQNEQKNQKPKQEQSPDRAEEKREERREEQREQQREKRREDQQREERKQSRENEKRDMKAAAKKAAAQVESTAVASRGSLFMIGWLMVSIPQGSIGLTKTLGVLRPEMLMPGLHVSLPGIHETYTIKTTIQTHTIRNIPCGTATGVLLHFDKVEVVSKLKQQLAYQTVKNYSINYNELFIRDKVHYLVNNYCSKYSVREVSVEKFEGMDEKLMKELIDDNRLWAPGIEIISLRITKPQIPQAIRANFQLIEQAKVQLMIVTERQKVLLEKEMTVHKASLIKAQSQYEVALIEFNKLQQRKLNELKMQVIQAGIYLDRKNTEADNDYLIYEKNVEADLIRLDERFLRAYGRECFSSNITFKLGDAIPKLVI